MYSKKYKIEKIEQFGRENPVYEGMEGAVCHPAYLRVGERGWILVEYETEWFTFIEHPHRLHTSIIKNVDYVIGDKLSIVIDTEHTRLTLREI